MITKNTILNGSLSVVENTIAKADVWFENDNTSFSQKDNFVNFLVKDGDKSFEFSISADIEASCSLQNSGGDGRITQNFNEVVDEDVNVKIYDLYSDVDVDFDLNDKEVNAKIVNIILKTLYN